MEDYDCVSLLTKPIQKQLHKLFLLFCDIL